MAANVFDARDAGPATTAGRDPFDLSVREITDGDAFDHSLCRRLSRDAALPREHGCWPRQARQDATLLAVADGLVVGRAVLEAPYLPYAELVNLCVRPDYRHRGAATAIVREALTRARAAGFRHLVVQEYLDEAQAHNVYLRSGFLPATVGEFRRLVHLVDVPLVSLFRQAHPEARHESLADPRFDDQWWKLAWTAGDDQVALFLHGGSCQSDSDGFQPVVQACELRSPERGFTARLESASRAKRGDTTALSVAVEALPPGGFEGIVRAMLLPDTEVPGPVGLSSIALALPPGKAARVEIPVRIRHEFATDGQRFRSYPSAPFTVELAWEGGSVLLSAAVIVD